jgi:hypothetical protein
MSSRMGRAAAVMTMGMAVLAEASAAQSPTVPSDVRLAGLGGSELFVAPRASMTRGPVRLTVEGVYGRGSSSLTEGRTEAAWLVAHDLVVDASYTVTYRASGVVTARDRRSRVGVHARRLGAWIGMGRDGAAAPGFDRGTRTLSARAWADVGPGIGLTARRTSFREHGETLRDTVHVILDEYAFHTRHLSRYFRQDAYSELEVDVGVRVGSVGVALVGGHRFEDGEAPAADWAFARLDVPVSGRVDLLAEAGRNGGIPSVGFAPTGFARLGVRLQLTGTDTDAGTFDPPAAPLPSPRRTPDASAVLPRAEIVTEGASSTLLLIAPQAQLLELRGDFSDWEPVRPSRIEPGRWSYPVAAGVHHLNIRLDGGEWTVPANLPTIPDEFSGAPVAVVVVR